MTRLDIWLNLADDQGLEESRRSFDDKIQEKQMYTVPPGLACTCSAVTWRGGGGAYRILKLRRIEAHGVYLKVFPSLASVCDEVNFSCWPKLSLLQVSTLVLFFVYIWL